MKGTLCNSRRINVSGTHGKTKCAYTNRTSKYTEKKIDRIKGRSRKLHIYSWIPQSTYFSVVDSTNRPKKSVGIKKIKTILPLPDLIVFLDHYTHLMCVMHTPFKCS